MEARGTTSLSSIHHVFPSSSRWPPETSNQYLCAFTSPVGPWNCTLETWIQEVNPKMTECHQSNMSVNAKDLPPYDTTRSLRVLAHYPFSIHLPLTLTPTAQLSPSIFICSSRALGKAVAHSPHSGLRGCFRSLVVVYEHHFRVSYLEYCHTMYGVEGRCRPESTI